MLPRGNTHSRGKIIGRKIYSYGNAIGRTNDNPILLKNEYCVDFYDGDVSEMTANAILESMYAACDDDGNSYLMMESIVEYGKNNKHTIISDKKVVHRGWNYMRRSTVGWQLCAQWIYGSTSRKSLRDLKESHTVETEEYAVVEKI